MNCPTCQHVALRPRQHEGVDLAACTSCRGVWLECGALEQLLWQARHGRPETPSASTGSTASHRTARAAPHRDVRPDPERRRRRASHWRRLLRMFDGGFGRRPSSPSARSA